MPSYFAGKNLDNLAWMNPGMRSSILAQNGVSSVLTQLSPLMPSHTLAQFAPSTWAQAFRFHPVQLFDRMMLSATMFDAMQAELTADHAKKHSPSPRKNDLLQEGEEATAGELDENYNSPDAIKAQEEAAQANKKTIMEEVLDTMTHSKEMAMAAAELSRIYQLTFKDIEDELGIADQEPMTDEQVREWNEAHQHEPEHLGIRGFLLDKLAHEADHFNLEQVSVAERFLDRLTAIVTKAGKNVSDLEKLTPDLIGKAFDKHVQMLSDLAGKMEKTVGAALAQQGVALPTPAMPPVTNVHAQINNQLQQMQSPSLSDSHNMDPAHRMDQLRLAAIKVVYPGVPQPTNALNQKIAPTPEHSSHDAIKRELEHYAKEIGVGLSTMGKAADRFLLQHLWPNSNPNHEATKTLMNDNPLHAAPTEKPKTAVQKTREAAMRPPHG